jgi:hypothetical protein
VRYHQGPLQEEEEEDLTWNIMEEIIALYHISNSTTI